jgi:DNA-binding NarL/FixJ family response regulator
MAIQVLLVDDHAAVRDGLRFLLESEGDITVVGNAGNGRQAVDEVRRLQPHVVIMDISMPHLNGIDATHTICQSCPSTKIVILSMYSSAEHIFQALKAGARGFLPKESTGTELVAAVRAVYSGRRYLSQKIAETMIDDYMLQRSSTEAKSPLERLSQREREVLQLLAEGKSNKKIADTLYLSPKSVETYRNRLMHKLGISNLPDLVKFAIQHGITPPNIV